MKNLFRLLIPVLLIGLIGCESQKEESPEVDFNKELSEIRSVIEQFELARESEDFSTIEQIWAPDEDIVLFGSEGDEQLVGFAAIKKAMVQQFDELENILISIRDQKIKINKSGTTAWFSQILNYNFIYQNENMSFEGIRFTGVLEKRENKWLLVQGHLSVPYDADLE